MSLGRHAMCIDATCHSDDYCKYCRLVTPWITVPRGDSACGAGVISEIKRYATLIFDERRSSPHRESYVARRAPRKARGTKPLMIGQSSPAVIIIRAGDFEIRDPGEGSRAGNAAQRESEVGPASHHSLCIPPSFLFRTSSSSSSPPSPQSIPSPTADVSGKIVRIYYPPLCLAHSLAQNAPPSAKYRLCSGSVLTSFYTLDFFRYLFSFFHRISWYSPRGTGPTPGSRQRGP